MCGMCCGCHGDPLAEMVLLLRHLRTNFIDEAPSTLIIKKKKTLLVSQERLQERIRVENELRDEKNKLLTVIKEKESEVTKERSELTQRLQEHEQVIEVSRK